MVEDRLPPRRRVRDRTYPDPDNRTDLVVLHLAEPIPPGVNPAPLRFPPGSAMQFRPWWAHGFPGGDSAGNTADGTVGEILGYGKVRLDSESRYHVEVGFSGAGLWSDDFRAVVGVVCQAHRNGDGHAITLCWGDQRLAGEKLAALTKRLADQADEAALAAWGWELTRDPQARSHWRPRARGVARDSERGYRFRGRTAALRAIKDWLDSAHTEPKALVVTGSPGVGKSAVLGRIITTADPSVRAELPAGDTAEKATVGSVACAVHAKGKTALEVAAEIARAANRAAPAAVDELTTVVQQAMAEQSGGPFNVIIDALDEATSSAEARAIVTDIVLPLAQTCDNVRVVVGTREHDDDGDLIGAFGHGRTTIDLDDSAYSSFEDLSDFALATLQLAGDERPGNPYEPEAVARPVAARIADLAQGNFLIAGLIARTYGRYDTVAKAPGQVDFPADIRWALDTYLSRLPPVAGTSARTVLSVLAFAEAPGFTAELWAVALRALEGVDIEPDRLSRFAHSSAANFLVETSTATVPTFRLFHQALNDALAAARAQFSERRADERLLTEAFLAHGAARGWARAPEYLLRSLASHAARGGAGDDLLGDTEYLLYADLQRIIARSDLASSQPGWDRIRLLRLTPHASSADPQTRAAMFSVTEALEGLGDVYQSWPDPVPYRATWASARPRTERMMLEGHAGGVTGVCTVTLDGRPHLASAGYDGTVRIWDATTGEQRRSLEGHTGEVYEVCRFILDGRPHLASAGYDGTVRIWDATTGEQRRSLEGHTGGVNGVCTFTLDGRPHLATASNRTVRIWDATTGEQRRSLEGHTDGVNGVCAFTLDGRPHLATASIGFTVRIWDATTGEQRHRLEGHTDWVRGVCAFTLDGRPHLATASDDRTVRIWDATTGKQRHRLEGHTRSVRGVCAFTLDGRPHLATASIDRTVRIWDATTGEQRRSLEGLTGGVNGVCAFTLDGRPHLATASNDRTVRIWDATAGHRHHRLEGHTDWVNGVCAFTLDGRPHLATAGHDRTVRIWDATTGHQRHRLEGHTGWVNGVCAFTLDGRPHLATAGYDRTRIWDATTGHQRRSLKVPFPLSLIVSFRAVCAFTLDGRPHLATAGNDRTARIWDATTGHQRHRLKGHTNGVNGVCAFTLDGRPHLATAGNDRTVQIWDATTGHQRHRLEGHTDGVNGVCAFTLDGRPHLASAGNDRTVQIWDATTGHQRHRLEGHTGGVTGVCTVTLDGRPHLASAGYDRTVRIWDLTRATCVRSIPVHHGAFGIAWDGQRLLLGLSAGVLTIAIEPFSS
ncbi:hypothetical protein MPTA5024_24655 [Microbispora sp. ATCC PTA-5024]|nr:hypothetical protein MPTA5024_24655 [Microbispora sp. ATCC PTA-5024]